MTHAHDYHSAVKSLMSAFIQVCHAKEFCLENYVYINEFIIPYNKSIIKYKMAFYYQEVAVSLANGLILIGLSREVK